MWLRRRVEQRPRNPQRGVIQIGFFAMSNPIDPTSMAPREALELAIGHYVTRFANLDTVVSTHIGYILGLDHKLVFFILKDVFFDTKVKLLRRSVAQKFGLQNSAEYIAVLNKIKTAGEFRNSLLHGVFAQEGENAETQLRGRLGESLTKFDEGLKETDSAALDHAARMVDDLAAALIAELPEGKPSSSNSLEQSGSGDQ
jgi:hypothetical protein